MLDGVFDDYFTDDGVTEKLSKQIEAFKKEIEDGNIIEILKVALKIKNTTSGYAQRTYRWLMTKESALMDIIIMRAGNTTSIIIFFQNTLSIIRSQRTL